MTANGTDSPNTAARQQLTLGLARFYLERVNEHSHKKRFFLSRAMETLDAATAADDSFDPLITGRMYRDLGEAFFQDQHLNKAHCCFTSAIDHFGRREDPYCHERSCCHSTLSQISLQQDDFIGAIEEFKHARVMADHITLELSTMLHEIASTDFDRDDENYEKIRCCKFIDGTMWLKPSLDDTMKPVELGRVHCMLGIAHCTLGNLEVACDQVEKAIQVLEEHDPDSHDLWQSHHVMGEVMLQRKALNESIAHFQQAAELAESTESLQALATTYRGMGSALRDQGDFKRAAAFTQRAIKIQEHDCTSLPRKLTQSYRQLGLVYQDRGSACHKRGDYDQAQHFTEDAIEIQETHCARETLNLAQSYKLLGLVYDSQGEHGRAFWCYRTAINHFEASSGDVEFDIYQRLGLAASYAKRH